MVNTDNEPMKFIKYEDVQKYAQQDVDNKTAELFAKSKKLLKQIQKHDDSISSEAPSEEKEHIPFENEEDVDLLYETRISNNLFSRLIVVEFCNAFFANMGIFLSIVNYEIMH